MDKTQSLIDRLRSKMGQPPNIKPLVPQKKEEPKKAPKAAPVFLRATLDNLLGAMQRLERDFKMTPEQRQQVRNFLYTRQVRKDAYKPGVPTDISRGRITGLEGLKPWEELEQFIVPSTDYDQAKIALTRKDANGRVDLSGLVAEHGRFVKAREAGRARLEEEAQAKKVDALPFTPEAFAMGQNKTMVATKDGKGIPIEQAVSMWDATGAPRPGLTQSQMEEAEQAALSPEVFPLARRGDKPIATLPELMSENMGSFATAFSHLSDEQREGVVGHIRTLPGGKEFSETFGDELFRKGATSLSDRTKAVGLEGQIAKFAGLVTTALISAPVQLERTRTWIENRDQSIRRGDAIPVSRDILDRLGASLNYAFGALDMFSGAGQIAKSAPAAILSKIRALHPDDFAKVGGKDIPTLVSKLSDEEIMAAVRETDAWRGAAKLDELQAGAEQPGAVFRPAGAGEQVAKAQELAGAPKPQSTARTLDQARADLEAAKEARRVRLETASSGGPMRAASGLDPDDLKEAYNIGRYTLEVGVRSFSEWSKGMIEAFGKAIKPHLKKIWTEAKKTATDPVSKFTRAIRDAEKTPRSEQRAYVKGLRREQAEKGFYAQQERGQNLPGAFRQAFKSDDLKPPGIKIDTSGFTQDDIGELFDIANRHFEGSTFSQANATFAVEKLLLGHLPEPNQMRLLEDAFGADFAKALKSKGPLLNRILDNLWEGVNLPRALMASFDFSAPLRQGMILTVANPGDALHAGRAMFKAFGDKKFAEGLEKQMFTRELFTAGQDAGLHISHLTGKYSGLNKREEEFMSRFASFVTGPSERAYVTYLNKLRTDVFDKLYTGLKETGMEQSVLDEQAELLASFINKASGRGSLSLGDNLSFERAAPALGALFFAPRYAASRIQFPLEALRGLAVGSPEYKKVVAKQVVPYIATWSSIVGLTKLHADAARKNGSRPSMDVELDPRSPDFGKIRIGPDLKTRIDMGAGFQQFVTYFARQATNETKRGGEVLELKPGKAFPYTSRFAVSERFLRSKLSPFAALLWDAQEGKMYDGQDPTIPNELRRNLIPLSFQDLMEAWKEYGPTSLALFPLSQIGLGVDTYGDTKTPPTPEWLKRYGTTNATTTTETKAMTEEEWQKRYGTKK